MFLKSYKHIHEHPVLVAFFCSFSVHFIQDSFLLTLLRNKCRFLFGGDRLQPLLF